MKTIREEFELNLKEVHLVTNQIKTDLQSDLSETQEQMNGIVIKQKADLNEIQTKISKTRNEFENLEKRIESDKDEIDCNLKEIEAKQANISNQIEKHEDELNLGTVYFYKIEDAVDFFDLSQTDKVTLFTPMFVVKARDAKGTRDLDSFHLIGSSKQRSLFRSRSKVFVSFSFRYSILSYSGWKMERREFVQYGDVSAQTCTCTDENQI